MAVQGRGLTIGTRAETSRDAPVNRVGGRPRRLEATKTTSRHEPHDSAGRWFVMFVKLRGLHGLHAALRARSILRVFASSWIPRSARRPSAESRPAATSPLARPEGSNGGRPFDDAHPARETGRNTTGPWGSLVSLLLGVQLTSVQIRADPLRIRFSDLLRPRRSPVLPSRRAGEATAVRRVIGRMRWIRAST